MIRTNDKVTYRGRTFVVAEIGEDGGLALRPIEQGGCSTPDFGEVEVEKKDLKEVVVLYY